jgi:hypothetical protein
MKISIMQPYLFPYLGYFQLIGSVDKFIFYNDVNFIKGGWINRNNILINSKKSLFTVPLDNASPNKYISDIQIHKDMYSKWKLKFLKSIEQSYKKAPCFEEIFTLIKFVFDSNDLSISNLNIRSIKTVSDYLGLSVKFEESNLVYNTTKGLSKEDRIIAICKVNNCNTYINSSGGRSLYDKQLFIEEGIDMFFIENTLRVYNQFDNPFILGLSIIDVLMFNEKASVNSMINQYSIS